MGASLSTRAALIQDIESDNPTLITVDLSGTKLSDSDCKRLGQALKKNRYVCMVAEFGCENAGGERRNACVVCMYAWQMCVSRISC